MWLLSYIEFLANRLFIVFWCFILLLFFCNSIAVEIIISSFYSFLNFCNQLYEALYNWSWSWYLMVEYYWCNCVTWRYIDDIDEDNTFLFWEELYTWALNLLQSVVYYLISPEFYYNNRLVYANIYQVLATFSRIYLTVVCVTYSNFFTVYFIRESVFVEFYYVSNENLWNDGLLIDFLQNNTINIWLSQYVICTGFLFSECLFFDIITRLYVDFLITNSYTFNIFETLNAYAVLNGVLFIYATLVILLSSIFFFIL